jgi:hypothetical protein
MSRKTSASSKRRYEPPMRRTWEPRWLAVGTCHTAEWRRKTTFKRACRLSVAMHYERQFMAQMEKLTHPTAYLCGGFAKYAGTHAHPRQRLYFALTVTGKLTWALRPAESVAETFRL